jgi:hypothetical protein
MIDVFYTTRRDQQVCDLIRIRFRDNESFAETLERAKSAVRRVKGNFSYMGR